MSIPKEPRQLMITIMYLVLTAMLALNVSAEIFNAFKLVDESLVASNVQLHQENKVIPNRIEKLAERDPVNFDKYVELAPQVRKYSDELVAYLNGILEDMIEEAGGWVERDGKRVIHDPKHLDAATRILVTGDEGAKLLQRLMDAQEEFLSFIPEEDLEEHPFDGVAISMNPDVYHGATPPRESWEDFMFSRMPLQAVLPIFRKYINDVRLTENNVLNYYLNRIGGEEIIFDDFRVVAAPSSSYIIRGETYEADLFLSAASTSVDNMEVFVNGRPVPIDDEGNAKFRMNPSDIGKGTYTAEIQLTNPATDEVESYSGTFEYEVGLRSANVSADKMNVFYIGVDNPISVSAAGIPTAQLNVSGQGGGIQLNEVQGSGKSKYNVTVSQPGEASVVVSGGGLEPTPFNFRVRRIPDPVARLGNERNSSLGDGQFRAQRGIIAHLDNFDFEARCNIEGFTLTRIERRQDPIQAINRGGTFEGDAQRLVSQAAPGDRFFFTNVRARCPGDAASRPINDLVFTIR